MRARQRGDGIERCKLFESILAALSRGDAIGEEYTPRTGVVLNNRRVGYLGLSWHRKNDGRKCYLRRWPENFQSETAPKLKFEAKAHVRLDRNLSVRSNTK
jgi:hypothetical protein